MLSGPPWGDVAKGLSPASARISPLAGISLIKAEPRFPRQDVSSQAAGTTPADGNNVLGADGGEGGSGGSSRTDGFPSKKHLELINRSSWHCASRKRGRPLVPRADAIV